MTADTQRPLKAHYRDVVVVTVNYRLGPLGFLSLGNEQVIFSAGTFGGAFSNSKLASSSVHPSIASTNKKVNQVPGNTGLRDQLMALTWVQVNASYPPIFLGT